MPRQYEAMRDALIKSGKSEKDAKSEAAATWNKRHPNDTNPWNREGKPRKKNNSFLASVLRPGK
jgi:hypothetical protein